MTKDIGNFQVTVWSPYPVWIMIRHGGQELKFSHDELRDLEYAVDVARRATVRQLTEKERETL